MLGQKARDFIANGAPSGGQRQAAVAAARNALSAGIPPGEVIRLVMQGFDRSPQDERRPWEYPHAVQIVNSLLSSPAPPPPPLEHRPSPGWDWGTPGANPQGSSEGSDDEPEDDSLGAFLDHMQTADFSPLIEGILDAGKSHWIWGDAGSGKTFLTLDWVFHLAQGKPYHGRKVRRTKSLLVEVDDIAQLPEYVETVAAAGQHDMEAIKANVHIVTKPIYHLKDRQGLQAILARVDAIEGLGLVVLDHFTKMTDPEVAWDARPKFVAELKDALSARGIALLVLDHGKVPPQNGEARDALNTLRGGSPKANIFHTGISITGKLKDGPIRLEWAKLRTGRRDNLLCSFNEDDGFTLEVEVDHNKLWDDLGKTDRAILDALTRRGPLGYDELTRETGKSLATLRRSVNNVLVPRGIIGHLSEGGNGRGDKARYGLVGGASPPRKKVVGWDF